MILPAIVLLAGLVVVLALNHRNESAEERERELVVLAGATAINARGIVDDRFNTLGATAASPTVRRRSPGLRRYLADMARATGYGNPGYVDRKGQLRVSADTGVTDPPIDLSDRPYVQTALAGRPAASDAVVSRVNGRIIVAFAHPVTGPRGGRAGLINTVLQVDEFGADLRRLLTSGTAARSSIIDGAGNLLTRTGRNGRALLPAPRDYPLERMRASGRGVITVGDRLLGFATLRDPNWLVVIDRDKSEVNGPLDRTLYAELVAVLLLASLGILGTLALARRLDRLDRERESALDEQRQIALTLQRSLLPELEVPEGLSGAARYAPAQGVVSVGGDWYDIVDNGDGRVALHVGDVAGHGLDAAATMGKLRSAGRVEGLNGSSPAEALSALERFAASLKLRPLATVAYAVLDLRTGLLRYALAGHPPPLIVRADGTTTYLEGGRSPLLGVRPPTPRAEAEVTLRQGDTLIIYTDGLVERPEWSIDDGMALLAEHAALMVQDGVPALADRLLATVPEPRRDDVAVLAVQLTPVRQPSSVAS